jgi:uncharacterized membrane protein YcgQ (UPF0703/DUF1980 family)
MIFLYLLIYLKQFIGACPRIVATKEHKVIRFDSFIALIITNVNKVLIKWFLEKVGMEHYYLNNRIAKVLIYLISLFSSARIITPVNKALINYTVLRKSWRATLLR